MLLKLRLRLLETVVGVKSIYYDELADTFVCVNVKN